MTDTTSIEWRHDVDAALGEEAERWFGSTLESYPNTDAAPEALYWRGVARYSETHDPKELKELGHEFRQRYQQTGWAKRASIW